MLNLEKRIFFSALLFLFFLTFFSPSVLASAEFKTSYKSTYSVNQDASVNVEQIIGIKNNLANIYVSEYTLTIGSNRLNQIITGDDFGALNPIVETGPNYTKISVKFKEKVIGKDKENHLYLRYQTPDFASINGQIVEVNIPSIFNKNELEDYATTLIVPSSFGPPSFIQPKPSRQERIDGSYYYYFSKERLLKFEGISAAFGEVQIFDFKLNYDLENPNQFAARTEIALPPDTPYQRVYYQKIEPAPAEIKIDEDENWLAVYNLRPKEKFSVTASGSFEIFIRAKEELKGKPLSEKDLEKYLKADKHWETEDSEIQKIAKTLPTAQAVYNFVTENLIYDYARLNKNNYQRLGAVGALKNKNSALCSEFSDLFIALARSVGIPAREVNGYAYTNNPKLRPLSLNQDILHAWVEYYDIKKNLWLPADPTWGNTTGGIDYFSKLDLNHIVFVRHGIKSDYPLPAGAYSLDDKQKNIFIDFGQKKDRFFNLSFAWQLPKTVIAGMPVKGVIVIKNSGEGAFHQQKIYLQAPDSVGEFVLPLLPPYGEYKVPVVFKTNWKKTQDYGVELSFGGRTESHKIKALPFYHYFYEKLAFLDFTGFLRIFSLL